MMADCRENVITNDAALDPADTIVMVRGLTKRFGAQVLFDALDLDVFAGEVLGVVGGSGQGKSVLLRCITGLEDYEAGTVALRHAGARDCDGPVRFGVLFQDGALFGGLTVLQNIEVPMREKLALPAALQRELAMLKLRLVGLPETSAHKYPSELSGGMRKRAGLARALALDPQIVFLDEPTAGLDPISAAAFDALIGTLREALGLTVYMVTHDLDSLFASCTRVAVLAERRIVRTGTPEALRRAPGHPWIEDYFCGPRGRAAAVAA